MDLNDLYVSVRRTRLVNLFQSIDKLSSGRSSGKVTGEDGQQLRYTISKLLQYVTGQGGFDLLSNTAGKNS